MISVPFSYCSGNNFMRNSLLSLFLFLTAGCSYHIFVPPGNVLNFQAPTALAKGEAAFVSGVGNSMKINLFDTDINSGFIDARYGTGKNSEIGLAVNALYFKEDYNPLKKYSPLSIGVHLSGKYNPEFAKKYLAFSAGIGGGISDLGDYVNFDCCIIGGFENPRIAPLWMIPFYHVGYYLGVPINPKPHDLTSVINEEHLATARITNGFRLGFGMQIPLPEKYLKHTGFSFYWDNDFAWLFSEHTDLFLSIGGGIGYQI